MRRLKRLPQNTPIRLPNVEITKEVKPMMTIGERIEVKEFIPTKANDIPMAKASMLVAIALSLIHISEPTRRTPISYAVFCLKKKKNKNKKQKTKKNTNK